MAKSARRVVPKTYFLNEQHELPIEEKGGGGRSPRYDHIDWAVKGQRLHQSLQNVTQAI